VIRQSIKGRRTPHPLTKDTVLWHTGSNAIGFVFRNSNQKGGNPLKGGKITCLVILIRIDSSMCKSFNDKYKHNFVC